MNRGLAAGLMALIVTGGLLFFLYRYFSGGVSLEEVTPSATSTPFSGLKKAIEGGGPEKNAASGATTTIRLYLIGIGDEGKGGESVGCGDSIIPVSRTVIATSTLLRLAYNEVLKLRTRTVEGLYNPLYQSDLTLDRLSINAEGNARVDLSGTLQTGGVCDDPRVIALLEKTAFQFFPTVRTVEVFVNGRALRDILSEK